jgi:hypothetical protein
MKKSSSINFDLKKLEKHAQFIFFYCFLDYFAHLLTSRSFYLKIFDAQLFFLTLCTNFLRTQENARISCLKLFYCSNKLFFSSLTFPDQHYLLGAGITTKLPRKSGNMALGF